jgi:peptidoglycan/xylan/chitin deacetylase (PgdA/CDA1 family)
LRIARRVDDLPGVALTFDDGPHPAGTPAVLAALERAGAHATFFLVGEQVRRDPPLAREIVAAGHAVALHGDRHRCQLRLTPRTLDDDLARVVATVADATGASPTLYRPPYGVFSLAGLALVRRRGWRELLWSRWGRDWRAHTTPAAIARRASRDLGAGDVILLHDADTYSAAGSWRRTAQALPAVLEAVRRAGLETVTL